MNHVSKLNHVELFVFKFKNIMIDSNDSTLDVNIVVNFQIVNAQTQHSIHESQRVSNYEFVHVFDQNRDRCLIILVIVWLLVLIVICRSITKIVINMLQRLTRLEFETNLFIVSNFARLDNCQDDLHNHKLIDFDNFVEQKWITLYFQIIIRIDF